MSAASYAAFLAVSLLVICTPGQDTALTIRNTLLGGRRSGLATAAGVSSGQAIWTLATSAGLAVILVASGPLFLAVRLAGAGYLIYLGVRSLIKAVTRPAAYDAAAQARRHASRLEPPSGRACSATCPTPRWSPSSSACCRSSPGSTRAS